MDDPRKPHFRFCPGAYEAEDVFSASEEACEVCGAACGWRYGGNIYAEQHPDIVCAACIATGRLADHLGGDMQLHDVELDGADPELETELMQRTPGVTCFNPFVWPVLNGAPLAFIGYGDDKAILALPEAHAATTRVAAEYSDDFKLPTPYVLIFRSLDGAHYAAALDFD